ncbi:TPA: TetR/AcrR family transcriptional regulator [Raoultella planticola]|uniref:TetR family transcriptional regulator n=1 Tax=Raoultella planticola TaxID=575 RepID=A0A443VJL1_RAOPL|nr:TetR/AcrR family transcriptional regulator [Raoultella planticola]RWT20688.1 TetR family transcriptional regulator [Raoultella planticola]
MRTLTEERRKAIIDAASRIFQEMGYERASMNEVAKRVGGSKATLYNYFSSKEELFETVVRTYSTRFLSEAASDLLDVKNANLTLEQKLIRFGERMLQVLAGDNQALQIYRVVIGEAGHSDIGSLFIESGISESMGTLSMLMAEAMRKGELTEGDPVIRAAQFTALVKAEADAMILKRDLPRYTSAQINLMARKGVHLFLYGALPRSE